MACLDGYQKTSTSLREIYKDGDQEAVPSEQVGSFTESIIAQARSLTSSNFPTGDSGADMMNGLEIDWECSNRRVRLVVPADISRRRYIYHRQGDNYDVAEVTPENLAVWLDWLSEDA